MGEEVEDQMEILKKIKEIKWDPVLTAAWGLAFLSAFLVHPGKAYLGYIDWRSLGILWSLMVVIQGLRGNGVFDWIGEGVLSRVHKGWQLAAVLVFLCFFGSMLITNDVALITFVPFAILILKNCGREDLMIPVILLQTIGANLGSMLTPIGNPQNLYLYGLADMQMGEFVLEMLPYAGASAVLILCSLLFLPGKTQEVAVVAAGAAPDSAAETAGAYGMEGAAGMAGAHGVERASEAERTSAAGDRRQILIYAALFVAAILTVLRVVPWYILVLVVFAVVLAMDRRVLGRADYLLLFTFVGFFIFTGNMGRSPMVRDVLQRLVQGRELPVAILASQCISNVPAALLLSGFTENVDALLLGVNIGGLGTLIASMASLISYKAYTNVYREQKGKYLAAFTVVNLLFLAALIGVYLVGHAGIWRSFNGIV